MRSSCFPHFLLAAAALLAGCASGQTAPAPATTANDDGAATLARLRALSAAATCSSGAQCRTVAIGAKACGGPEGYLPWSNADPAAGAQVAALAAQYTAARREKNRAAPQVASDCRVTPDPGALCVPAGGGHCVLGPSGVNDPR